MISRLYVLDMSLPLHHVLRGYDQQLISALHSIIIKQYLVTSCKDKDANVRHMIPSLLNIINYTVDRSTKNTCYFGYNGKAVAEFVYMYS
jgi:hypothetical protein